MIQFGKEICADLEAACSREWLETNGLSGFASSTLADHFSRLAVCRSASDFIRVLRLHLFCPGRSFFPFKVVRA
jgi:hypothetical protein